MSFERIEKHNFQLFEFTDAPSKSQERNWSKQTLWFLTAYHPNAPSVSENGLRISEILKNSDKTDEEILPFPFKILRV